MGARPQGERHSGGRALQSRGTPAAAAARASTGHRAPSGPPQPGRLCSNPRMGIAQRLAAPEPPGQTSSRHGASGGTRRAATEGCWLGTAACPPRARQQGPESGRAGGSALSWVARGFHAATALPSPCRGFHAATALPSPCQPAVPPLSGLCGFKLGRCNVPSLPLDAVSRRLPVVNTNLDRELGELPGRGCFSATRRPRQTLEQRPPPPPGDSVAGTARSRRWHGPLCHCPAREPRDHSVALSPKYE